MDRTTNQTCSPRPDDTPLSGASLLALVGADGGDLGTTLLRLAQRAAAMHRFEVAAAAAEPYRASGTERPDSAERLPSREPLR